MPLVDQNIWLERGQDGGDNEDGTFPAVVPAVPEGLTRPIRSDGVIIWLTPLNSTTPTISVQPSIGEAVRQANAGLVRREVLGVACD